MKKISRFTKLCLSNPVWR